MMEDEDIKEYHKIIDKLQRTYKPLPNSLTIKESPIEGLGLFATEGIGQGTNLGTSHIKINDQIIRTPLGGFVNNSDDNNCVKTVLRDERYTKKWNLIALKNIKKGEELTLKYTFYRVDKADKK